MTNYLIPIAAYLIMMFACFFRGIYNGKEKKFFVSPNEKDGFLFISIIMFLLLTWSIFFYFIIYLLNKII
jgi:ABC-type Na+ efflux pump permease subunit